MGEPTRFELDDGSVWLRHGECCHCGWCCEGCALRDAVRERCLGYGGEEYRGYGCATWPDPSFREKLPAACSYSFERIS